MKHARPWIIAALLAAALVVLGLLIARRLNAATTPLRTAGEPAPAPVAVAPVQTGTIEDRRVFSASLEAIARVTIAPKVPGRILSIPLDIGDRVDRGTVVARLDSAEFEQATALAQAELAVAQAGVTLAQAAADNARRAFDRVQTLHEYQDAPEAELDTARAELAARDASLQAANAQVLRAEAALEAGRIRQSYATIRADWEGGDDTRIVAERLAEEGDTVSANTPLLSIVELDPIDAVIYTTERDYALFAPAQPVTITTDAHPDRQWQGAVSRIAPVFREGSRQARVEVRIPNPDAALKPGMFARVHAVLATADEATIVPIEALAQRAGRPVVFVVDDAGTSATMVPVEVGLTNATHAQVTSQADNQPTSQGSPPPVQGRVVTLGQQLLGERTPITIPSQSPGEGG